MEQLVLYVNSSYIIGAYCSDGVSHPIQMLNGEDRAWLYFYEDTDHNEISFGKQYEAHYLNRDYHYYGDVFDYVCDYRYMFTQYEHSSELRNVFKASSMFDQFKQPFVDKNRIETYITFSDEITNAARSIFIKELKDVNFDVRLSVVPCEQLVIKNLMQNSYPPMDGITLILNALGDNLWYSVYELKDGGLVQQVKRMLPGMGMDMRERALVEEVLQKVNRNYFVKDEEVEYERQRFNRLYTDEWMRRLDEATMSGVAIPIANFTFSIAPQNILHTSILLKDIDNRTKAIVDDIVREICTGCSNRKIKRAVMLGDAFSSLTLVDALKRKLNIANDMIFCIPKRNLSEILGVYPSIGVDLFSGAEDQFKRDAENELSGIAKNIEEEERQKGIEAARRRLMEEERQKREVEMWYSTEMQNVRDYEESQEYGKMLKACMEALKHKPGDEEAEKKRNDAIRYMAREEIENRMYADAITRAKDCVVKKQYSEALTLSEVAISLRSDSKEAQKIKRESLSNIERKARIKDFITSATVYYGQSLFDEAEKELKKIIKLDAQNEEALALMKKIEKRKADIEKLTKQFDEAEQREDVERMESLCSEMKEYDSRMAEKWLSRIDDLREKLEQKRREEELLGELREKIDSAMLNEDWEQVVSLCKESLGIKKSEKIQTILSQVQERIKLSLVREKFLLAFSKKEWREADGIIKDNPNLKNIPDIKEKYDIVKKNMRPKPPVSQPQQPEETDITINTSPVLGPEKKFKRPTRQISISTDNKPTYEQLPQKLSTKTKYPKVKRNKN